MVVFGADPCDPRRVGPRPACRRPTAPPFARVPLWKGRWGSGSGSVSAPPPKGVGARRRAAPARAAKTETQSHREPGKEGEGGQRPRVAGLVRGGRSSCEKGGRKEGGEGGR